MRRIATSTTFPIIAVLALVLVACGAEQATPSPEATAADGESPAATSGEGPTGGTVRIGIGGSADSLNPGVGVLAEAYALYELVYDTPIAVTDQGEYVPELATEWSASEDGLTWTMTIRDDAVFHDGEPLTAEDVAFSLLTYRDNEGFPFLPSYVTPFVEIEATDEQTVVLTTEEPINNFEPSMAFIYVIPQHIWEQEEDPVAFENADMIGSGAFRLTSFTRNESAQLETNADYWGTVPGIDGVIFQTIANPDARVTALTTGEVYAITEFPPTAVPTLQNAENVFVHIADVAAGGSLSDIFFNIVDEENCPEDAACTGHPALKDVQVRRALAMATDKQQLIEVATLGTGSPGLSLVPPGLGDFYAAQLEDYAYDPAAAGALLDEAGYEDTDGDGVRECLADQDCDDLTFRWNYPTDTDSAPREAEVVQAMWSEIGVAIEIQGLDSDTLTSVCCPSFDFDVINWGWGTDPDPAFLLGVALCDEIPTGFSETGYCNPDYDDLYAAQATEQDLAARVDIIHEMQRVLLEDVPYIIPYYEQEIEAWRTDRFTGWNDGDPTLGLEDPSSLVNLRPTQ